MAHFARVLDGYVVGVHVLNNSIITDENEIEKEELGQSFLANLYGYEPQEFVQCSYNSNFRGCYPGLGFSYDAKMDIFTPPPLPEPIEAAEAIEITETIE